MALHDLIEPIPDGARAGRRMEGGYRHANALHGAAMEYAFEDDEWCAGFVLAGRGKVGLVLDGSMEGVEVPLRVEHVLKPETARDIAYALMLYADVAERRR